MWIEWFIWIVLYILPGFIQSGAATDSISCEEGWYNFRDKCYKLEGKTETGKLSWEKAAAKCVSEGGNLATIQSKNVQEFLVTFLLMDAKTNAWIGLNDRANNSVYVWEDGSAFNFTEWQPNEPLSPNHEWEHCVEMIFIFHFNRGGLAGQWNDHVCSDSKAYICEKKTSKNTSPDPRLCSDKQGGWKYENNCYHVVSEKKSWDDAEQHCQEKFNGHLLTVLDFTVDVFVEYILMNIEVWIGIQIQDKSLQQWSSGWYVGYSDWNKDESEDFVPGTCSLRSKNKWRKVPCSRSYSFICETSSVGPPVLKQPVKDAKCPELSGDWLDLGGEYCYIFDIYNRVSWHTANSECARKGGTLASIHSEEESIILNQFVKYTEQNLHIGLLRHADTRLSGQNVFVWSDGSPMDYKNWHRNEPNNEEEKCGDLWTATMTWWDLTCSSHSGYICSVRKVTPIVTEQTDDWTSGLLFKVVIGVSVCIFLVVILIGYIICCFRTREVQRRGMSSVVELRPEVPSSPRPRHSTGNIVIQEDNYYYETM